MLNQLSEYLQTDYQKQQIIDGILNSSLNDTVDLCNSEYDVCQKVLYSKGEISTKYCPKCGREYGEDENFCFDCACALKNIKDIVKVRDISFSPAFPVNGMNNFSSFSEIFAKSNTDNINRFDFSIDDFNEIIKNIKITALKNMDDLIRFNDILLNRLNIQDNVLLFAKSFVDVQFKSYGQELGHFEFSKICVDERLTRSLMITTLIHELSHFILKEILVEIICKILDCIKNPLIESLATFILSYSSFTQLIDEYCAHTVEGRFTLFGYQDYSSFLGIEKSLDGEMSKGEIEITKSIGNTFSIAVKDILESYIDDDLRSDIKDQFQKDTRDLPNYDGLSLENCNRLTDDGFIKAIWLILNEGFEVAGSNISKLEEYVKFF